MIIYKRSWGVVDRSFQGAGKSVVSAHFSPPRTRSSTAVWRFRWERWGGGDSGVKADWASFDLFLLKAAMCNSSFLTWRNHLWVVVRVKCQLQMSRLSSSLICPLYLKQYVAHSTCSVNLC